MNDAITLYYYTAWDGFAWQGCDETTARSLQGYMEATKTLPKSSADEPPFGGAVPCKLSGQVGVAVYRYLTRKKGDLSGRDSLYLALAFVPLDTGCVDFARILELPQLTVPQSGELGPETISASERDLLLMDRAEEPGKWLVGDISGSECRILKGRDGLRKLSALFFSRYTQLGFLNAVFRSDSGVDGLVSTQSYRVYPEVTNVMVAAEDLRQARKTAGGVLERNHEAVGRMKDALGQLENWSKKQQGYRGLKEFHAVMLSELNDDSERIMAILEYMKWLDGEFDLIRGGKPARLKQIDANVRSRAERLCADLPAKLVALPVLDHESYREAVRFSQEVMYGSARILGALDGDELAAAAEDAKDKALEDLEKCRSDADRARRAANGEIERLKEAMKAQNRELEKVRAKLQKNEPKHGLDSGVILDPAGAKERTRRSFSWMMWVAIFMAVIVVGMMTIFVKSFLFGNRNEKKAEMQPRAFGVWGIASVSLSNAVPSRVEKDEDMHKERGSSNGVAHAEQMTARKCDGATVKDVRTAGKNTAGEADQLKSNEDKSGKKANPDKEVEE